MGHRRIWDARFDLYATGGTLYTMPAPGLVHTCASGSRTMQTSASTVATGVGVDVGALGRESTTHSFGLQHEPARTNIQTNNTDVSVWAVGTCPVTTATAPDGVVRNIRMAQAAAGQTRGTRTGPDTITLNQYVSCWIKRIIQNPAEFNNLYLSTGAYAYIVPPAVDATWWRTGFQSYFAGSLYSGRYYPCIGGATPCTTDVYGYQVEDSGHPTSVIVTAGASVTRAGTFLTVPAASLVVGGRVSLEFDLRPKGAATEYTIDGAYVYLAYWDANNHIRLDTATRRLEVTVNGVLWSPVTVLAWNRLDRVRIWVAAGDATTVSYAKYQVNEGAVTDLGNSGAAQAALSAVGTIYLLNTNVGAQFSSWVYRVSAFAYGDAPAWAGGADPYELWTPHRNVELVSSPSVRMWSARFDLHAFGGTLATMPPGLTHTCASNRTVQTSESTVIQTVVGNAGALGRERLAHSFGLQHEGPRTNHIVESRGGIAGWVAGTGADPTLNATAGPDGAVSAGRWAVAAGGLYSRYQNPAGAGLTDYTSSVWVKEAVPAALFQSKFFVNTAVLQSAVGGTPPTTWRRYDLGWLTGPVILGYAPCDGQNEIAWGGIAAGARDSYLDFHQFEVGRFTSSAIITAGAAVLRLGTFLSVPAASVIFGGQLSMEIDLRAKGSSTEYSTDGTFIALWWQDANNNAMISTTTRKLVVTVNGTPMVLAPVLVWARGDRVRFWVRAGAGAIYAYYRVNEDPRVYLGTDGSDVTALPASAVYLLGSSASYQFSSWVYRISAYARGSQPRWV